MDQNFPQFPWKMLKMINLFQGRADRGQIEEADSTFPIPRS